MGDVIRATRRRPRSTRGGLHGTGRRDCRHGPRRPSITETDGIRRVRDIESVIGIGRPAVGLGPRGRMLTRTSLPMTGMAGPEESRETTGAVGTTGTIGGMIEGTGGELMRRVGLAGREVGVGRPFATGRGSETGIPIADEAWGFFLRMMAILAHSNPLSGMKRREPQEPTHGVWRFIWGGNGLPFR